MEKAWMRSSGDPSLPTVLFLHGFLGCKEDWDFFGLEGVHALAIDLPGHGENLALPPSFQELVYQLKNFIDECKVAHLVGYSMGGRLALALAAEYPRLLSSLTLVSTSAGLESEEDRSQRRLQDERLACRLENEGIESFLRSWYGAGVFSDLSSQQARAWLEKRKGNSPSKMATTLRSLGTGQQRSYWKCLKDFDFPVDLVVGEKDQKFLQIAQRMEGALSQGRLHVFPECGHLCPFEKAASLNRLLSERVQEIMKKKEVEHVV